jgi:hypothetical protein
MGMFALSKVCRITTEMEEASGKRRRYQVSGEDPDADSVEETKVYY